MIYRQLDPAGYHKKPTPQSYFLKWESVNTPFCSKVMSADRFSLLCKFLHFENNQLCDQTVKNQGN